MDFTEIDNIEMREILIKWRTKMKTGIPYIERDKDGTYTYNNVYNINSSKCYECGKLTIWVHDKIVYPSQTSTILPNADLPEDIRRDYEEAGSILDLSPRGAAALLRLCIQKLCKHLGQPGENLNSDIGALVAAGLNPSIQKALDAVRVIGNNAVHPGAMDLMDDRATAESLFRLLNLIAEKMISEQKHVDEVYALLPPGARAAIEARDSKKTK